MPDELPAGSGGAPEQQQPQPTIDWESPDNPYRKRYEDTHAWGNGLNERVQKYESDPQAYYELGAKHGVQFEFEEPAAVGARTGRRPARRAARAAERRADDVARAGRSGPAGAACRRRRAAVPCPTLTAGRSQEGLRALQVGPHGDPAGRRSLLRSRARMPRRRRSTRSLRTPGPTSPVRGSRHRRPAASPTPALPKWGEMSESDINEYMAQRFAGNA
jgi:hypothetical protein